MSHFSNPTEIVAKQYTEWTYPKPIEDMVKAIENGYSEYGSPNNFGPLLWRRKREQHELKILIAGCGTNQAAYNALVMPNSKVTAIDISINSLNHSEYLKNKHGLKNLSLHQISILDAAELNEKFDLIICCGVLHHMEDPLLGLIALKKCLAAGGVMHLMLYGKYFRHGVYMLQDFFSRLQLNQSSESISLVKDTLKNLPQKHPIFLYAENAEDLEYDSGIVDTFLHKYDKSYTVDEIFNFAHAADMAFVDWEDRCNYSATSIINSNSDILKRILLLDERRQWPLVELFNNHIGTHRFLLCHPEDYNLFNLNFNDNDFINYIPHIRPGLTVIQQGDLNKNKNAILKRSWHQFTADSVAITLLQEVNSIKTISEIIFAANKTNPQISNLTARNFFKTLHDWGHLMFFK